MPKKNALSAETELRIIGGRLRGSKLRYHGDPVVRPMKHRVREAIFDLISTDPPGKHAIDLFAGTGALGLEALSRGAESVTLIEKHVPTARIVAENIAHLGASDRCQLLVTSAFLWAKRDLPQMSERTAAPWIVFCSPPYLFFHDRTTEMMALLESIQGSAPAGSIFVVESDEQFDFGMLPGGWQVRTYAPAQVGVLRL